MTSELEQEFYETFGIEPKWEDKRVKNNKTYYTEEQAQYLRETTKNRNIQLCYPEIPAEKLLEMICLINKNTKYYNNSTYFKEDYKDLKDEILEKTLYCYKINCLFNKEKEQFKQQIQQLYKEEHSKRVKEMTIELEQEFYDTFGIEPEYYCTYEKVAENLLESECTDNNLEKCKKCKEVGKRYPKITAEKLLEMICIYNNNVYENEKITPSNIDTLKEDVLHWFITDFVGNDKIKHQIQQLFEVNNEHR